MNTATRWPMRFVRSWALMYELAIWHLAFGKTAPSTSSHSGAYLSTWATPSGESYDLLLFKGAGLLSSRCRPSMASNKGCNFGNTGRCSICLVT